MQTDLAQAILDRLVSLEIKFTNSFVEMEKKIDKRFDSVNRDLQEIMDIVHDEAVQTRDKFDVLEVQLGDLKARVGITEVRQHRVEQQLLQTGEILVKH